MCNVQVQASHLHNNYAMLRNNKDSRNYLTHCLSSHSRESTGSILFITRMCIAVVPCGRDTVSLFESYNRKREGRPDPNGYSVLLKFPDLVAVANYMISCYCQGNLVQFEGQFIAVHFEQFSISFCSRLVGNLKDRIQNVNFAPIFAIDQIKTVKPSKIRKKISITKMSHDHINKFRKMIKQAPFYFCCVCNRYLYRSNVKVLKPKDYDKELLSTVNTKVKSFDGKVYTLQISKSPVRYQEVVIMAKGQSLKLRGTVVNVPKDVNEVFNKLPNCDHIVLMKLKNKLMYKGHVCFEPVNPEKVRRALALLNESNHFYSNIKIEIDIIPSSFFYFNENNEIVDNTHKDKKLFDFSVGVEDSEHNGNEDRNQLHEHWYIEDETLMVNNGIIHETAPGEGHVFSSILDKKCE